MNEEIILGSLLGDAYISKLQGRQKSYKIGWQHSESQRDYAIWKAESALPNFSIYERTTTDKRTLKSYSSVTCYSTVDDYKYYRELFYVDNVKTVSDEILAKLTSLSVAVWFMDDGNLYYNGNSCHLTLSVNGFDEVSIGKILLFFKDKYDINFKKSQKAIRITSVKEVKKWEKYFKDYYHSSMNYKTLEFNIKKYNERK